MYLKELTDILGIDKVSQNETELFRHGHDESSHPTMEPEVVCFPETKEDVVAITNIASKNKIPITPFGAGTGLEGQAIPINKGIVINFERMNKVIDFSPENLTITVQPGITRMQLNEIVNRQGLYFPTDPGADASIGGMVATNASGTTAVRYGSMRDQLLDLEIVLMNGDKIHTGTKAKKSSSGYHLTGLFAGSEGTLGIITEVTIRLHGLPEYSVSARCTFPTIKLCVEAAQIILRSGISVLKMELVDDTSIHQVNKFGGHNYPVEHSVFLEFAGSKTTVEEEVSYAKELLTDLGCKNWDVAKDSKERTQLWKARTEMSYAFRHLKGMNAIGSDVCVPIDQLPKMAEFSRNMIDESGLLAGILGHMGDGNFHTIIVYNQLSIQEKRKAEKITETLGFKAIELGGTCTGEHGVGIGKKKFQEAEHGTSILVFKQLKNLFDPDNLLNPGKII